MTAILIALTVADAPGSIARYWARVDPELARAPSAAGEPAARAARADRARRRDRELQPRRADRRRGQPRRCAVPDPVGADRGAPRQPDLRDARRRRPVRRDVAGRARAALGERDRDVVDLRVPPAARCAARPDP